jgi:hypothetical protein
MGFAAHGSPDAVHGNIVFASCGQEGGGYGGKKGRDLPRGATVAYRLTWEDPGTHTSLKVEKIWTAQTGRFPIYYNGFLYTNEDGVSRLDPKTGTVLGKSGDSQYCPSLNTKFRINGVHYYTIAGGRIFGFHRQKLWAVGLDDLKLDGFTVDILPEAMEGKRKLQYGSHTFHSGNRTFYLWGMIHPRVLCVGDPRQPTRLSAIHDGKITRTVRRKPTTRTSSAADSASESSDTPSTATASTKTPTYDPDDAIVKKWDVALLALVRHRLKAGDQPRLRLDSMGTEARVVQLDGKDQLTLMARGARVSYAAADLSLKEKAELACDVADAADKRQAAVAAFYCLAAGRRDGEQWLGSAGALAKNVEHSLK